MSCSLALFIFKSYLSHGQKDGLPSQSLAELKMAIRFTFLTQKELMGAVKDGFLEHDEFGNFFLAAAPNNKEQFKFQ